MHEDTVQFVDLYAQYLTIKEDIDAAIADVIKTSAFIRGQHVDSFEETFAKLHNMSHCVSCANGTDALYIAMRALSIKPGDEVIAPAHSWISTSETITQAGGKVVFCDTGLNDFTIDPKQIEGKITSNTVGIIPVHLYGQPADMDAIMAIAKKHNLWVIEDCAQAHLARYKGQLVGTFGNAACFSFYPGKNLGAMGDAGAIITNDESLATRMAMFARHGGIKKGDHHIEGINSRLDGMQAAILSVKMKHIHDWTKKRQQAATYYSQNLVHVDDVFTPKVLPDREHVWHLYVIRHEKRDLLAKHLGERNVKTVINYPIALPFLPAYSRLNHKPEQFPNAYFNQSRILSLPIYAEIQDSSLDKVIETIRSFTH